MSRDDEVVRKIVELEKRLDDLVKPEVGPIFHPLTTPYTHTSFDGDSFSTVAVNTLIDNASWSTTIPADAVALALRIRIRDSGSTGGAYGFALWAAAAGVHSTAVVFASRAVDDQYSDDTVVVPCTAGDIWYTISASGAVRMDVWLWCFGYWR